MLPRLHVEHELPERAVQAGQVATQEGEARARQPRARVEIHAQRRGDVGMFARGEGEGARGAPARYFDIVRLVRAVGDVGRGQVGDDLQRGLHRGGEARLLGLQRAHAAFQRRHFGLQRVGAGHVLLRHRRANILGRGVAAGLRLLQFGLHAAQIAVDGQQALGHWRQAAARQCGVKGGGFVPDQANVMHGAAYAVCGAAVQARKPLPFRGGVGVGSVGIEPVCAINVCNVRVVRNVF